jgi:hypothetical protein
LERYSWKVMACPPANNYAQPLRPALALMLPEQESCSGIHPQHCRITFLRAPARTGTRPRRGAVACPAWRAPRPPAQAGRMPANSPQRRGRAVHRRLPPPARQQQLTRRPEPTTESAPPVTHACAGQAA